VPSSPTSVTIGATVPEIVVFLDRPLLTPVAISANNEDAGIHTNLVVTFPYVIEVCSASAQHTWTNVTTSQGVVADTDIDGTVAQPANPNPVTLTVGGGGTTITLEENYGLTTQAFDPQDDLFVQFNGVTVKPAGSGEASCRALNLIELRDSGLNVVTRIHVNDP
jgi:hypothetical protein